MEKISIRKAKYAKSGLQDFCNYITRIYKKEIIIAEIGSYVGDSTEIFAKNFTTVYSIDPWLNGYDDTDGASTSDMTFAENQFNSLLLEYPNIIKNKAKSLDFVKTIENEFFDIVYIDGNHQYEAVKEDILAWLPKVKKGGFITGHDWAQKNHPGVQKAVLEVLGNPDVTFKDTSWIKRL
jgi:hypothetical protein